MKGNIGVHLTFAPDGHNNDDETRLHNGFAGRSDGTAGLLQWKV